MKITVGIYSRVSTNDFINQDSEINKTIKSLFDSAVLVDEDDNILNQAHKRILKGNPPGKNGSIGDAIVWEILINHYKDETVYIISEYKRMLKESCLYN